MKSPLNRAGKKHRFGKAWMHEHVNDPTCRRPQQRGYRSRAAFKLIELDARDRLLRPGMTVVDLGSAPGSWSQVLHERLGAAAHVVAIDLLPMDGIAGVRFIEGDFASDEGLAAVERALDGRKADLVPVDMAPNLSGIDAVDQARSVHLADLALEFARSPPATRRRAGRQSVPGNRPCRVRACREGAASPRCTCASPRRPATAAASCSSSPKASSPRPVGRMRQAQ
jgi:23S rRNA (uridine2552-2'-O)-methyltransferase